MPDEYVYGDGSSAPVSGAPTQIINHPHMPDAITDGTVQREFILRRKCQRAAKKGNVAQALYFQSKLGG